MGNRNSNSKYENPYSLKRRDDLIGKDCGEHGDGGSLKLVKLVLTKGELEWLLQSLKGDKKSTACIVSDVLGEIKVGREERKERSDDKWKPSLECIAEDHVFVA
ncbi:hypothetical protein ZOSMA_34G00450 [Zostera marina]|uniref:Uncharacterized protein n=1 Tax=Zostera marina TaxID=29655 RepID=A0A0K9P6Y6_ZOSMR|nr:hypothetical protein ZOSMA_34G00450 [Zostera marina]